MKLLDEVNAMKLLDDDLKQLEQNKEAVNKEQMIAIQARILFAQQIQVINQQYAMELKRRLTALEREKQQSIYKNSYGDVVDGYENPHEKGKRYATMDEVTIEIRKERERISQKNQDTSQRSYSYQGGIEHGEQ